MPLLVASILASSAAFAGTPARDLEPGEVRAQLKGGVDAAIGACYLGAVGERAGAGKLEVVLSIHRKGLVDHIDVRAPGLTAKRVAQIDGCVREALAGVKFPARRVGTTAVVPYFWQKTAGAGPIESCWNADGCTAASAKPKAISHRHARRAPRG